jgi:anti-sigma factor RsiW
VDCKLIGDDLLAFHLGSLEEPRRAAVEAHLCGCADCLRAFLALKRAVEIGGDGPRPSSAARARLREAVAREFPRRRRSLRALAAAALVALALAGWYGWRRAPEVAAPAEIIDSARAVAANLHFL